MRFGRNRTQAHRAGGKTFDDLGRRFHFVQRNRFARIDFKLKQTAQSHVAFGLIVDDLRVFFVGLVVVAAGGLLQFRNRIRRPHMLFAAVTPCVFAAGCQFFLQILFTTKGFGMHGNGFLCHLKQAQTADIGRCAFEVFIHQFLLQADGLENLRAGVGHIGGNTHF